MIISIYGQVGFAYGEEDQCLNVKLPGEAMNTKLSQTEHEGLSFQFVKRDSVSLHHHTLLLEPQLLKQFTFCSTIC